jgi:hypothetical protein
MLLKQESRAHGPRRCSMPWKTLVAVLSMAVLTGIAACEPEIGNDPVPEFMEFDTATGRIPEPTVAAVSQTTGYLDFAPLGFIVPKGIGACLEATDWPSVAECEFFQYLETLDGYPTLSTMRTPATAALNPDTITYAGNADDTLVVLENGFSKVTAADGLLVRFNPDDNYLYIDNPSGWEVGAQYVGALRGYDNGVVTTDGTRVVASVIYNLLKREESLLSCELDAEDPPFYNPTAEVDAHCKYYELVHEMYVSLIPDPDVLHATVVGLLHTLESLRQGYKGEDGFSGMWDVTASENGGNMPKDEVAVAWAWPTHTQTTVEVQPVLGMVPIPEGNNIMRLPFKGAIDASTLISFAGNGAAATVYLLNATELMAVLAGSGSLPDALPVFNTTLDGQEIVITADLPLVDGDQYIIMLAAKAEDDGRAEDFGIFDGPPTEVGSRPIVPSPLTVFLRTRGALVDADGNTLVSKMDSATAVEAEEGRQQMAALLDNDLFGTLTGGLIRENVVYVYAFDYTAP